MNINKDEIEKLFSAKFEKFEVPPLEKDWELLSSKLSRTNFWKFHFSGFNIYYLVFFLGMAGLFIWLGITNIKLSKKNDVLRDSIRVYQQESKKEALPSKISDTVNINLFNEQKTIAEKTEVKNTSTTSPKTNNNKMADTMSAVNAGTEPSTFQEDTIKVLKDAVEEPQQIPLYNSARTDTVKQVRVRRVKKMMVVKPDAVIVRDTVNLTKRVK